MTDLLTPKQTAAELGISTAKTQGDIERMTNAGNQDSIRRNGK